MYRNIRQSKNKMKTPFSLYQNWKSGWQAKSIINQIFSPFAMKGFFLKKRQIGNSNVFTNQNIWQNVVSLSRLSRVYRKEQTNIEVYW